VVEVVVVVVLGAFIGILVAFSIVPNGSVLAFLSCHRVDHLL
jgi:hypothetical protein